MDFDTPIEELELSVRVYNLLREMGVVTVEDLFRQKPIDLIRGKGHGKKVLLEIRDALLEGGFHLIETLGVNPCGHHLKKGADRMKAVVVVKVKGGFIAFPFEQPITLTSLPAGTRWCPSGPGTRKRPGSDIENAVPVEPSSYNRNENIGKAVVDVFEQLEEKEVPA